MSGDLETHFFGDPRDPRRAPQASTTKTEGNTVTDQRTVQAIKIGVSFTPNVMDQNAARAALGIPHPLYIRGGRMTLNAAIQIDGNDPDSVTAAAHMVKRIQTALAEAGTIHKLTTQFGRVPADQAVQQSNDKED